MRRSKLERSVSFYSVSGEDSYEGPGRTFLETISCLVSRTSAVLVPEEETAVSARNAIVHFKKHSKLASLAVGDEFTVGEEAYEVSTVDLRGVLPGGYPMKVEGVMK